MTLPRRIANELGIVMDDQKPETPNVSHETRPKVIDVVHNSDGSKTVMYFGKQVGHIYPIGYKNRDGMKYRAISNYDDIRHFYSIKSATQFLLSSHH